YGKMHKLDANFSQYLQINPDKMELRRDAASGTGGDKDVRGRRMWQHDYTGQAAALTDTSAFVKQQLRGRYRPHSHDDGSSPSQQQNATMNEQGSERSQSFGE